MMTWQVQSVLLTWCQCVWDSHTMLTLSQESRFSSVWKKEALLLLVSTFSLEGKSISRMFWSNFLYFSIFSPLRFSMYTRARPTTQTWLTSHGSVSVCGNHLEQWGSVPFTGIQWSCDEWVEQSVHWMSCFSSRAWLMLLLHVNGMVGRSEN